MAPATAKQKVLEAVQQLPPDATVEDAMERLYFLAKVERGARSGRCRRDGAPRSSQSTANPLRPMGRSATGRYHNH